MKSASKFWSDWGATLLLVAGVAIGGLCGYLFGPAASVVKPVGDIFMNMLFVLVVPLVFFSTAQAACNLRAKGMVGSVLLRMVVVFLAMSVVIGALSYIVAVIFDPLGDIDRSVLAGDIAAVDSTSSETLPQLLVRALTVSDFPLLFSKLNLLPLIIFSVLFGLATSLCGEKGHPVAELLSSGTEVTMKLMQIVMYAAPVGMGCYFADVVANMGGQIMGGYLRTVVIYVIFAAAVYFVLLPLYILVSGGFKGLRAYWRNILPPSVTAIATCSSSACIPMGIQAAKKMGVNPDVADGVIPLGINIHKDGSVALSMFKCIFLLSLVGQFTPSPGNALFLIFISVLVAAVVGAVACGAMTGELMIISILGLDPSLTGIIMIIAVLLDMPGTLLNAISNVAGTYVVDKMAWKRK